jgi:CBS domain-containing protein
MDRNIVAVSPATTAKAAHKLAIISKAGLMPVLQSRKLVGIVSEEQLGRCIKEKSASTPVKKIMMKPVFVDRGSCIEDARAIVISTGLSRLPVVDSRRNMLCIGTISSTKLV